MPFVIRASYETSSRPEDASLRSAVGESARESWGTRRWLRLRPRWRSSECPSWRLLRLRERRRSSAGLWRLRALPSRLCSPWRWALASRSLSSSSMVSQKKGCPWTSEGCLSFIALDRLFGGGGCPWTSEGYLSFVALDRLFGVGGTFRALLPRLWVVSSA